MMNDNLIKQSAFFLSISILVVVFADYAHALIVYIDVFYTLINLKLATVFSSSATGVIIRQVFTLVLIPVVIAAIPALSYRLIKGKTMPYFIQTTWLLWMIIVLSKVLIV